MTERPRALAAFAAAIAVAAAVVEVLGGDPLARNVVLDVGLAAVALHAARSRGRPGDLPWPRSIAGVAIPAAAALLAGLPMLGLPYIEDDWRLLEIQRRQSNPFGVLEIARQGESWFRLLSWLWWWCNSRIAPLDATFARVQQ
ncbi:MAG TPA: hypothetical protein VKE69_06755, partial [Planctomycetota bacterium]|nr:hypothetical protein [Planctomycetota bacterium]